MRTTFTIAFLLFGLNSFAQITGKWTSIDDKCDEADPRFKKKVIGMEILQELSKNGDEFSGGHILDPENGKVYRCKLWIEDGVLKVRGYWGPFFRTQTWKREAVQP